MIESFKFAIQDIEFGYPESQQECVFKNISLTIKKGETFFLLGPNGTGKSTLLKCMAGLLQPESGTILLDEEDVYRMKPQIRAKRLSYVSQHRSSPFPFLVKDIVLMGRAAYVAPFRSPSKEDEEKVEQVLQQVGISHLANKNCKNISGGEWQLVMISRAMVQDTGVLLLDEPTSHLDLGNQMKVLDVISRLSEFGTTIIVATHFPDHALINSSQAAVLKDGGFLAVGSPDDVICREVLSRAYGITIEVVGISTLSHRKVCVPLATEMN